MSHKEYRDCELPTQDLGESAKKAKAQGDLLFPKPQLNCKETKMPRKDENLEIFAVLHGR
jgi:hypothetical protein